MKQKGTFTDEQIKHIEDNWANKNDELLLVYLPGGATRTLSGFEAQVVLKLAQLLEFGFYLLVKQGILIGLLIGFILGWSMKSGGCA